MTSVLATIVAEMRFAGSTEYSARTLRIHLVCAIIRKETMFLPITTYY